MTAAKAVALYVRIPETLHAEIVQVAEETGNTITATTAALIRRGLWLPDEIDAAVKRIRQREPRLDT